MKYKFSEHPVIERYGVQMYSILNESGKVCAYSQKKFDIPKDVIFMVYNEPALIFEKAVIWGGVISGGEIWGGVIWGGVIWGGVIRGGEIWGGVISGGEISGGVISGGVIWGGEISGGEIWGGEISGGVISGGEIWGGVIRGGEIWGGEIWGGEIWGGEIWGGEIWGGEIWGGEYTESMLQIQGSAHFCYAYFLDEGGIGIGIGCIRMSINDWIEKYKEIGAKNQYTADQIEEYGAYIDLFAKRYLK